jgi:hypothetical protein
MVVELFQGDRPDTYVEIPQRKLINVCQVSRVSWLQVDLSHQPRAEGASMLMLHKLMIGVLRGIFEDVWISSLIEYLMGSKGTILLAGCRL